MPAHYIGEHVVISGTVEGGRRLNWVRLGPFGIYGSSLLRPEKRTSQDAVTRSFWCHKRSFLLSPPVVPVRNATPASKFLEIRL
jgi:hypothetical protein